MTRRTRKKTTIITETDRLLIFGGPRSAAEVWRDDPDGLFDGAQTEQAAALAASRLQTAQRPVETVAAQSRQCSLTPSGPNSGSR